MKETFKNVGKTAESIWGRAKDATALSANKVGELFEDGMESLGDSYQSVIGRINDLSVIASINATANAGGDEVDEKHYFFYSLLIIRDKLCNSLYEGFTQRCSSD